jgi:phosphoglycerate dehydrogenase-like enzyme
MFDMTGKTVVLSGAGGVGREVLRGFLEMGMNAAIFSSSTEKGEQSRSMLPKHLQERCRAYG